MKCKVTVGGADAAPPVVSEGELSFSPRGFDLDYFIAGDRCLMSARGGVITQSRRGDFNCDITFARGKNTVCMLLSGELTGSVPVKTEKLEVCKSENGVAVELEYYLGGAKILLSLKAVTEENL